MHCSGHYNDSICTTPEFILRVRDKLVRLSEQTVTVALCIINKAVFITEVESVYCAVRTESLYNTDTSRPLRVNIHFFTMLSSDAKTKLFV